MVEIWQWTPFVILLMLAALQTLPAEVYEAARLENASAWQQFLGHNLPDAAADLDREVVFIRMVEAFKLDRTRSSF